MDGEAQQTEASDAKVATRYNRVVIWLHWTIAVLIAYNIAVGFWMEGVSPSWRRIIIPIHMSSGITVLVLTIVRILWRVAHEPPPHSPKMAKWEVYCANLAHISLYGLMIAVPLSGWAIVSTNPPPNSEGAALFAEQAIARGVKPRRIGPRELWWTVPLPMMSYFEEIGETREGVEPQRVLHDRAVEVHAVLAIMLIFLLLLHIGGALKHQWMDGDDELARMGLRWRRLGKPSA